MKKKKDVSIAYASFNLRDQIRNGESTPLHFFYEATNCRLFYPIGPCQRRVFKDRRALPPVVAHQKYSAHPLACKLEYENNV